MQSFGVTASYVVDLIILAILAVVGFAAGKMTPNKRPFSLNNPNINLPYKGSDTVTISVAAVISVGLPAALISLYTVASLVIRMRSKTKRSEQTTRRLLWKLHVSLMGLLLSAILAFLLTNGTKNLFGKPRPNLLGRCQPDLANVAKYVVSNATEAAGRLVSAAICTNKDKSVVDEGFRSFPSGHASAAASGLVYFSLWIAAKLGVWLPVVVGETSGDVENSGHEPPTYSLDQTNVDQAQKSEKDAAAPLYCILAPLIPFFGAIYICATRWYDFQHHGLDIMSGFIIGTISSILAFRYYYQPVRTGKGVFWKPRPSRHRETVFSCCRGC